MSDCRFGVSPVNYPDPDPDPLSSVCMYVCMYVCVYVVNTFKHLLLRNRLKPNSYVVSMGWGNESLFKRSWSDDQVGHHAHIWNQKADDLETWYAASGSRILPSVFK